MYFFPGRVWKGLVCEFPFPSRPGPARPDPTRPDRAFRPPRFRTENGRFGDAGFGSQNSVWYESYGNPNYFGTRNPFSTLPRPPGALSGALLAVEKVYLHETASQSSVWAENHGNPHYFGTRNPFLTLPRPPGALLGALWPLTPIPKWGGLYIVRMVILSFARRLWRPACRHTAVSDKVAMGTRSRKRRG